MLGIGVCCFSDAFPALFVLFRGGLCSRCSFCFSGLFGPILTVPRCSRLKGLVFDCSPLNWCYGTTSCTLEIMVNAEKDRMPASSLAVIGCPITVRADQCLALPLPLHASDPGTATTLLHVQGIAYGSVSGAAPFSVFVLQANHTFHQENWNIFTFNGGCQDIIPIVVPTVPTIYGGDFTDVWQLRDNVWAICPEMQTFRLRLYDRSGNDFFYVTPFQPSQYFVSVHPSASLVFTNTLHQMLVLQAIVHSCQLHNASPRYWLGSNYTMILEDWGRWRSQYGLEWIAAFGFSRVPPCIVSEMIQLCQEAGVLHVGAL